MNLPPVGTVIADQTGGSWRVIHLDIERQTVAIGFPGIYLVGINPFPILAEPLYNCPKRNPQWFTAEGRWSHFSATSIDLMLGDSACG